MRVGYEYKKCLSCLKMVSVAPRWNRDINRKYSDICDTCYEEEILKLSNNITLTTPEKIRKHYA